MDVIKKIWSFLSHRQRIATLFLIAATLLGAVLESVSIGLIVPLHVDNQED